MTKYELLKYKMNAQEEDTWSLLCDKIRKKFAQLDLSPLAYEILDKKLFLKEPFGGAMGYANEDGYFHVSEGDRGQCSIVFVTKSCEDAENQIIKKLAHDIGYECILKEKDKIERANRRDWRFYRVIDGIAEGRVLSHNVENEVWKYNTEYDYRKYWFELTLYILKGTVSAKVFREEVLRYEKLMNYHFIGSFWKYDVDTMKFICA